VGFRWGLGAEAREFVCVIGAECVAPLLRKKRKEKKKPMAASPSLELNAWRASSVIMASTTRSRLRKPSAVV